VTDALCSRHPEVASTFTCERCGRFGCEACAADAGLCSQCFVVEEDRPPSALAKIGLALGVIGTFTLLPGIAGLVVGRIERGRIAGGVSPRSGLPLARGAIILGWVCAAALGALGLWALSRFMEEG